MMKETTIDKEMMRVKLFMTLTLAAWAAYSAADAAKFILSMI